MIITKQRRQLVELLREQGPLYQKDGRLISTVASVLEWSSGATSSCVDLMVREGAIVAERRGRRTFRLALAEGFDLDAQHGRYTHATLVNGNGHAVTVPVDTLPAPEPSPELAEPSPGPAPDVDPHAIAAALLDAVLTKLQEAPAVPEDVKHRLAEALADRERFRTKLREAEDDLAGTKAALSHARRELLDVRQQYDALKLAAERQGRVIMSEANRNALDRLVREAPRSAKGA